MREILLINVSGQDRPGLTVALADALARHDVNVLDMGQAVIHDDLAWGMLVEVPRAASEGPVYKDLLFAAHKLGLQLRITPVDDAQYRQWVAGQGQPRHIITLLARNVSAKHIAAENDVRLFNPEDLAPNLFGTRDGFELELVHLDIESLV